MEQQAGGSLGARCPGQHGIIHERLPRLGSVTSGIGEAMLVPSRGSKWLGGYSFTQALQHSQGEVLKDSAGGQPASFVPLLAGEHFPAEKIPVALARWSREIEPGVAPDS